MFTGYTDVPHQRTGGEVTQTLTPLSMFNGQPSDPERKVNVTQQQVRESAWTGSVIGLLVAAWCAAIAMGFFAYFLFDSFRH